MTNRALIEVSIVVPCCNEQDNVEVLYRRVASALGPVCQFEVVFVDDGSSDRTWATATALTRLDPRARALRLSRNFGHQPALMAGLSVARGRAVVSLDADLQHPPELLPQLVEQWRRGSFIVTARRSYPPGTPRFKRWSSGWFYRVFSILAGVDLGEGSSDFRLLDRAVVSQLLQMREGDYFLRGLVRWVGFDSTTVDYVAAPRHAGTTKYSFRRMCQFAASAIVSFSVTPLRLGIGLGVLAAAAGALELLYVLVQAARGQTVPGWASVVGIMVLCFSAQFVLLGVMGEYIGRIHLAAKRRPAWIVRERTWVDDEDGWSANRHNAPGPAIP